MLLEPSEEEQMLRDAVRGIATSYGAPYMRECIAEERPPVELWDELGKGGFLGVNLPTEYGGGGWGCRGWPRCRRSWPRPSARWHCWWYT